VSAIIRQSVSADPAKSTAIWWPLRAWLGVEVLFGLAASAAIFLDPVSNPSNFAWPIKPTVMAATLGAFYVASLFTLVPSLFVREWQNVRVIVLPGAIFTAVLLLATILHWDRFSTTLLPFYIWLASYVLPPPIFAAMYWWHQSRSRPTGADLGDPMPGAIRGFLLINGLILTVFALIAFVVPAVLQSIAPWTFTPLTARAFCGFLSLAGLFQIGMAWENDLVRARLAAPLLIAFPFAMAIQLYRFAVEVAWSNLALWVFLLDIVVSAIVCLIVLLRVSGRRKHVRAA
jgi:hypothetical protein